MKRILATCLGLAALALSANTPPEISNVRASQREGTKLVDIHYDAADADGDALKIRVEISDNDGAKYSVPARTFTGDIGEGIVPGKGKHIVWDAGADWDGEYSDQMRVKIYAIDAQGFPGLEWGDEVPPGGFLMGQDGGAEGSGPSRHVNIPWSYWLSKYEITNGQYCDFLNAAYAAGNVYLEGTTAVRSSGSSVFEGYCNAGVTLCSIGDAYGIRWNVNNFEVTGGWTNRPALVTYMGATAFARFYGYDLPTDAEWEKAARGPDHDDQDEHLCYPWGNAWSTAYANSATTISISNMKDVGFYNGGQTPIGPDTVNGYGLYDVIGNAPEWTRTAGPTVAAYDAQESLLSTFNLPFRYGYGFDDKRLSRGKGSDMIHVRTSEFQTNLRGFRVARRYNAADVKTRVGQTIGFDWTTFSTGVGSPFGSPHPGSFDMAPGVTGSAVQCTSTGNDYKYFYFKMTSQRVCYFTAQVKNTSDVPRSIYLRTYSYQTESSSSSDGHSSEAITLPANMSEFRTISFDGGPAVYELYVYMTSGLVIDNLQFHVTE